MTGPLSRQNTAWWTDSLPLSLPLAYLGDHVLARAEISLSAEGDAKSYLPGCEGQGTGNESPELASELGDGLSGTSALLAMGFPIPEVSGESAFFVSQPRVPALS